MLLLKRELQVRQLPYSSDSLALTSHRFSHEQGHKYEINKPPRVTFVCDGHVPDLL